MKQANGTKSNQQPQNQKDKCAKIFESDNKTWSVIVEGKVDR